MGKAGFLSSTVVVPFLGLFYGILSKKPQQGTPREPMGSFVRNPKTAKREKKGPVGRPRYGFLPCFVGLGKDCIQLF